MKPFHAFMLACGAMILIAPLVADSASAQTPSFRQKMNAYVGCINRLSARAFDSRKRYFSWAAKSGPTGKERIIYGLYTIYDTADCRKNVEKANAIEPHDDALEAAATAFAEAAGKLEPLLKEADDYYTREDYKDDKMAKGRALHPRLVARPGMRSRPPTASCAAKSRRSTTSARWRSSPPSNRTKAARRATTSRR